LASPRRFNQSAAVNRIAFLLRADRPNRPVFLLGAGASFRAGIPLADEGVKRIARAAYQRHVTGARRSVESVKPTDWLPWLQQQGWFISDTERFSENFPLAVEHLLVPREFRREFLMQLVEPVNGLNDGYRHLADLMMRGLVHTALTTNFDGLIVQGLREKSPHIRGIVEINRHPGDLEQFTPFGRNQVGYLHGAIELYTDRNDPNEVLHLPDGLISRLRPLLDYSPLVIVGYRGAEQSVMVDLLEAGVSSSGSYRRGIYWCTLPGSALHPNVDRLRTIVGSNFVHLEIEGFDELLRDIASELKSEDSYVVSPAAPTRIARSSHDEELLETLSLSDIDEGLVLSTLATYCDRLGRAQVTSDTCLALLRELGLVGEGAAGLSPTLGCYLLFGRDVAKRYPHASVVFTRSGKGRRVFSGNLISQFQNLIEYLDGPEVNAVLRVKTAMSAEPRRAFPKRALVEAVVNLLVHRDYAATELATIEAEPGAALVFRNPGGLTDYVLRKIAIGSDGSFLPVRDVTDLRNPSLADIFFGVGSMDKAGSGLADVRDLMLENGGDAVFVAEDQASSFKAILKQPVQGSTAGVARPVSPVGIYVTNLLPFSVMPQVVSVLTATGDDAEKRPFILPDEDPALLPVLAGDGSRLVSFANLNEFPDFMRRRQPNTLLKIDTPAFIASRDQRRLFVWLLRKHWELYLDGLEAKGFYREEGRNRAYFHLLDGQVNTLIYDSPKRRGIHRDVVKRRGERSPWHENEGVAYSIVEYDATWAIQIKPFYMFTGKDGVTPLPPFERTARATRRMRFDRNKNVEDDLTFWARFLSAGSPSIRLPGLGVGDLVIDAAFLQFEVPETAGRGSS